MIAREEARLRTLFRRLLFVSAAAGPIGCGSSAGEGPADGSVQNADDGGGGVDATVSPDGGAIDATAPGLDSGNFGFDDAGCYPDPLDGSDDRTACQFYLSLPCGLPPDAATEGCYLLLDDCARLCTDLVGHPCAIAECLAEDAGNDARIPPGAVTLECTTGEIGCAPGVGRRPGGLAGAAHRATDAVGGWLASMAHLEAASVHAFRRLGAELASLGAPRAFVRAAARSARDEVRHARVASRLARRRGAAPAKVRVAPATARSIEALAIENAVEGCVRESFGALVATRQAARAADPAFAREMGRIARDETRHAVLAWGLARWLRPRLDDTARARVDRATQGALASLRCEVAAVRPDVARELGLPAGDEARALVDAFAAAAFA